MSWDGLGRYQHWEANALPVALMGEKLHMFSNSTPLIKRRREQLNIHLAITVPGP